MSRPPGDPIPIIGMPDRIEVFLTKKGFELYCIACLCVFAKPNSDKYLSDLGKFHINAKHGGKFAIPKLNHPRVSGRVNRNLVLM